MKKSIFSKVAAAVMAGAMVLGMTVTAFAADPLRSGTVEPGEANDVAGANPGVEAYVVDTTDLTDEQRASIATAEFTFDVQSNFLNGGGGYNENGDTWKQPAGYEFKVADGEIAGTQTYAMEVSNYALGEDGSDSLQVQMWWLNTMHDADGNVVGAGSASLVSVTLKDAAGNVIKSIPAATDTPSGDSAAATALILAAVAALAVVATVSVKKFAAER